MTTPQARARGAAGRVTGSPVVERTRQFMNTNPLGRFVIPLLLFAIAFSYPFWYDQPGISFLTRDILGLELDIVVVTAVYVMLALGLNIVVGYAGLLDLGYVAFYALGAYTLGWFASGHFSQLNFHFLAAGVSETLPGIHISFWLVLILAGVVTAIAGVIIGWPTLRLRGDYLAIVTLGFGEIIPDVFRNADSLSVPFVSIPGEPWNLTNGVRGIKPLDKPGFYSEELDTATDGYLPDRFGIVGDDLIPWFWLIVAMVLITVFVNQRLRDSKMGRAWIAVREDEIAASAMGVPLMRTKLWAYGIGAIFGGFAGAFYGSFIGAIFPTSFFFNISILILVMVIVGGMGNIYGVVLGAVVIQYLNLKGLDKIGLRLNQGLDAMGLDLTIDVPKYKFGIFGILLVTMMLFRPGGFIPSARRKAELEEGTGEAVLYDAKA